MILTFGGCSKTETLAETYRSKTYSYLVGQKQDEDWKNELVNITTKCYNIYKLDCLQNNRAELIETNYKDTIVVGNFSIYANKQEDNYVCFSGSIKVFLKDDSGHWQTNRYSCDFKSNSYLGRSDFITYDVNSNAIRFQYSKDLTYLGTYGEGISTYWDVSCVNYTNKDILKAETDTLMWSMWSIKSTEDWCYRIKNEMYYTYNLQYVIF
jgi:hypothetical protein